QELPQRRLKKNPPRFPLRKPNPRELLPNQLLQLQARLLHQPSRKSGIGFFLAGKTMMIPSLFRNQGLKQRKISSRPPVVAASDGNTSLQQSGKRLMMRVSVGTGGNISLCIIQEAGKGTRASSIIII